MRAERDEARERVKDLTHDNENLCRRLESVRDVYRLYGLHGDRKIDIEKLKQQL